MASVYRAGPLQIRRHATGMDLELIDRLSQAELDARLAEMERLHKQLASVPPDLVAWNIEKRKQIRDSLPYPEFKARLDSYHKQLEDLPGTGYDALSMRQAVWQSIVELKKRNVYPEGIEETLSKAKGVGEWNHSPARSGRVTPVPRERGN